MTKLKKEDLSTKNILQLNYVDGNTGYVRFHNIDDRLVTLEYREDSILGDLTLDNNWVIQKANRSANLVNQVKSWKLFTSHNSGIVMHNTYERLKDYVNNTLKSKLVKKSEVKVTYELTSELEAHLDYEKKEVKVGCKTFGFYEIIQIGKGLDESVRMGTKIKYVHNDDSSVIIHGVELGVSEIKGLVDLVKGD